MMYQPLATLSVRFDALTLFGLIAVSLMLAFYALEDRSPAFILAFAGACVMGSIYGFLQGAWPFGMVEGIWSFVALRRWWIERRRLKRPAGPRLHASQPRDNCRRRGNSSRLTRNTTTRPPG